MNSEERFKKSLNELLGSKEFPFDEANWEKAREIIDASKKSKQRLTPIILTGLLFLGVLVTGSYFMFNPNETLSDTQTISSLNQNTPSLTDQKYIDPAITTSLPEKQKTTNISKLPESPAFVSKSTASSTAISSPINQNETQTRLTSALTKEEKTNEVSTTKEGLNLEDIAIPLMASVEVKMTKFSGKSAVTEKPSQKEIIKNNSNEAFTPALEFTGKLNDKDQMTPVVKSETNSIMNEKSEELAQTAENSIKAEQPEKTEAANIPPVIADTLKKDMPTTSEVSPLVLEGADIPESIRFLAPRFSIEAGASYLTGWKNPENRDANGFNPVVGINYFNPVSFRTSLSVGLQYSSVGNLSYSNYTSKVTHLKLGEESDVSIFTPVRLHYLIVPLRLNYDLSHKNTIGLGCNVAYLWNVESEVETYTEKLNSTEGHSISKTYGYTQGFKKIDAQVSAFYRRRLYPNLSVNAEVFFGMTDVKDDKFFNSKMVERNTGAKLTLVYNILKK